MNILVPTDSDIETIFIDEGTMKRIYTWKEGNSGQIVEVRRTIAQYNVPPTLEEAGISMDSNKELNWIKFVDAVSITGNLQKGNYGRC